MIESTSRKAPALVTVGLIVLGVVFAATGAVYLAKTAGHLPGFFPGYKAGSAEHHTEHGLAALMAALACWAVAWFAASGRRIRLPRS